jgi:uncharacterized protein YndB with AHSA1/START domain
MTMAGLLSIAAVIVLLDAAGVDRVQAVQPNNPSTTVVRTSPTEVTVRRRFAAPPDDVFAALTRAELLRRWMSAAGRDMVESQVDARTGGRFRYVFRSSSGRTFGMYGDYREVVPGKRIVHTESYDGYDWEPLVTTTELNEDAGGTVLVMTIRYPNEKICDADFPNIKDATADGFTRLDALLAKSG